jgi:exodeoxyribonuclease VII small subunit
LPAVPTASKAAASANPPKDGVGFEAALKELEAIVEAMESEDLPLETLLRRYEEGVKLAQVCQTRLAEAEQRIVQLEQNLSGEFRLRAIESELSES